MLIDKLLKISTLLLNKFGGGNMENSIYYKGKEYAGNTNINLTVDNDGKIYVNNSSIGVNLEDLLNRIIQLEADVANL